MSTIASAPVAHGMTRQSWVGGVASALKRRWLAYITWRMEQAAIAHLKSMSDRDLKDIGIARSQIEAAVKGSIDLERNRTSTFRF